MSPMPLLPESLLNEFDERVVTLCDGRHGLRRGLTIDIREPDGSIDQNAPRSSDGTGLEAVPPPKASAPILEFIASSELPDRYEEVLSAAGWRLDNYRRNPVFQNAHQYGDIVFTLGKALLTEVRVEGSRRVLFQRIEFATAVNPMARIAYGLYQGKFLSAVSVGFIPVRWEMGAEGSGYRRKFVEQELLEVSAVGIPANPEALAVGLKAGAVDRNDVRELLEVLRASISTPIFGSNQADPRADICALGARGDEAQLLQLARDLRQVLKQ